MRLNIKSEYLAAVAALRLWNTRAEQNNHPEIRKDDEAVEKSKTMLAAQKQTRVFLFGAKAKPELERMVAHAYKAGYVAAAQKGADEAPSERALDVLWRSDMPLEIMELAHNLATRGSVSPVEAGALKNKPAKKLRHAPHEGPASPSEPNATPASPKRIAKPQLTHLAARAYKAGYVAAHAKAGREVPTDHQLDVVWRSNLPLGVMDFVHDLATRVTVAPVAASVPQKAAAQVESERPAAVWWSWPGISLQRAVTIAIAMTFLLLQGNHLRAGEAVTKTEPAPAPKPAETSLLSFADGKIVFDVEERVRFEVRNNNRDFDSSVDDDNDDAWLLNRFRFGIAVKPVGWLKIYAQTQDAREAFSDRANIPGVRGAEGTDAFDLRQGYIAIGDLKRAPVQFTIGRQILNYGDSRLVGDSKWGNLGRTFDAARLRYETKHFWAEAFASRPVQLKRGEFNDSDAADNFFGLYLSTDAAGFQTTDAYLFYRNKNDNQPDLDPTNKIDPQGTWNGPAAEFVTVGARVKSTPEKLGNWDYTGEMAVQAGDVYQTDKNSARQDLLTFAAHANVGYTCKETPWKPRLALEYDFASGDDDPTDGDSHSFQNLFPSNHEKYGFMDEFSWRNIHDIRVQTTAKPAKGWEVGLDYHAFFLANTADYWYRSNGISTLRTKTPAGVDVRTIGASPFAGHEVDLTVSYEWRKNVKVQAGYSHFFAGAYLRDTGADDDADFGYLMTTFTY